MLASFVVLVPLVLGIYTVYAARDDAPGYGYAVLAPWAPMFAFVGGTALLLIEGTICIAMALPIFMISASLGGLIGLVLVRNVKFKSSSMNALLMLPLLSGYAETHIALPQQTGQSTETIHIAAKPEVVWGLINRAVDIQPTEMSGGLAYMIGVPYPIEAVTQSNDAGRVRKLRWAKDVRFDEPITAWEENRYIKWTYDFKPDSFPAGALDDHVLIGGRYFDLIDTSYRLQPEAGGTRLDIVVSYRVSTNFNWYAGWWGRVLVDDSANAILRFYKRRSEQA
ncbi:SRPBCC family protein [Duganella sp. BJB488]|uniref:SRPBCC family protein n=1 Tax=unclassified Duganella TaxID=2636909 RepID=UPI000E341FF4|nr:MULTISPECIES: SRPBCC family protein [unclassified Duganella]RFP11801.1 SRPBCC family protein [Duganella sp. BJB489]RFP15702.1 SRPBCC family protein [Duganella sp. BJB488]RFP30650.1 SRPBCC family protein [Duganella sp. BJB480]